VVQTGTYISGLAHLAVIGWAILGGGMAQPDKTPEFQITDVSLVSKAQFSALGSAAPVPVLKVSGLTAPNKTGANAPVAPKPAQKPPARARPTPRPQEQPGVAPNLSDVKHAPPSKAQVRAPQIAPTAQTDSVGATLIVPTAPISTVERAGMLRNRPQLNAPSQPAAPKIDSRAAPKPPNDAQKSTVRQKSTTPVPAAKVPPKVPPKPLIEKAPSQAATEIVTEAKKTKNTAAPVRSSRPRGRPAKLADRAKAARAQQARQIEQALIKAQQEAASAAKSAPPKPALPSPTPSGPPLTSGEKNGLRLAVQECWNVNPSSQSARITVTVAVTMERNGKPLASSIRLLSASDGSDAAKNSAFGAARRAILRCGKSGYKLPLEKYDRWRDIEMTFNPDKMRIK